MSETEARAWKSLAPRVSFGPLPVTIESWSDLWNQTTVLKLSALVPDRDHPERSVNVSLTLNYVGAAADNDHRLRILRHLMKVIVKHEVDENFKCDGARPFEPHPNGEPTIYTTRIPR